MKRTTLNILVLIASVAGAASVARGQYAYNAIVDGPYCSGDWGSFSCGVNGGGIGNYPSYYSNTNATCQDDVNYYFWCPAASANLSNPYGCSLTAQLLGGAWVAYSDYDWFVGGVQSAVYTYDSAAYADMDCFYDSYTYNGIEPCSQLALLTEGAGPRSS
jgi:hypothetical protein